MSIEKNLEDKDFTTEVIDFFKDLVIIVVVVKLITIFIVSVFIINGQSMYASYYDKEFILVDRYSTLEYKDIKKQDVKRGDVVVFRPGVDVNKEYFIKRVIGMPKDTIKIEKGFVFLKKKGDKNFIKLEEKYLNKENLGHTKVNGSTKTTIYTVPEGSFFVMGDNRNHSSDSRSCFTYSCSTTTRNSFVKNNDVTGKVLVDFGYFNYKNFSFVHPEIKDNQGKFISTKPKWTNSPDSFNYEELK